MQVLGDPCPLAFQLLLVSEAFVSQPRAFLLQQSLLLESLDLNAMAAAQDGYTQERQERRPGHWSSIAKRGGLPEMRQHGKCERGRLPAPVSVAAAGVNSKDVVARRQVTVFDYPLTYRFPPIRLQTL